MSDLAILQRRLAAFRDARRWREFHTASELARAVAVEAGELNELFLWDRHPTAERIAEELADVLICALNLCNTMGFDAATVIEQKIAVNEARQVSGDGFGKAGGA